MFTIQMLAHFNNQDASEVRFAVVMNESTTRATECPAQSSTAILLERCTEAVAVHTDVFRAGKNEETSLVSTPSTLLMALSLLPLSEYDLVRDSNTSFGER